MTEAPSSSFEQELDRVLDLVLSHEDVGPEAKHKLHGILDHYRAAAHPFTQCVRENRKRFGPVQTEKVCATVKDIIRSTHNWRGKGKLSESLSEVPIIDEETARLLDRIPDQVLENLIKGTDARTDDS